MSSSSGLKLHGHILSTCSQRILFAAGEKEQKVDLVVVNLMTGQHKSPAHMAIQPFGKVPVLEDNGFFLFESRAVVNYLEAKHAGTGTKLVPTDLKGHALYEQWMFVEAATINEPLTQILTQRVWGPHKPHFTFDENKLKAASAELDSVLTVLDAQVGKGGYIVGNEFTAVDIFLTPYISVLMSTPEKSIFESKPNLAAWWQKISSRPAWKAVHEQVVATYKAIAAAKAGGH